MKVHVANLLLARKMFFHRLPENISPTHKEGMSNWLGLSIYLLRTPVEVLPNLIPVFAVGAQPGNVSRPVFHDVVGQA